MKTDLKKLTRAFDALGIGYRQESRYGSPDSPMIVLLAREGAKVVGYSGFAAEFYFNEDGSFDEVGIWE